MSTSNTTFLAGRYLFWLARIWGILSAAFLLFMIGGHIFGNEPQIISKNDFITMIFFPSGVLIGLLLALRYPAAGGLITVISTAIFFILRPDAATGIWFWLIAAPAILFLLHFLIFRRN